MKNRSLHHIPSQSRCLSTCGYWLQRLRAVLIHAMTSNKRKHWFASGNNANKKQCTDLYYEGITGVLVTCNLREVECLRETYSLLNEYNDKLQPDAVPKDDHETTEKNDAKIEPEIRVEVSDMEAEMQKEIAELKSPVTKKFRQIPTKCKNIIFVQILNSLDPHVVVQQIFQDIQDQGKGKARYVHRLIPVQRTCKATIESVEKVVSHLLGSESKEESSFMVLCKIRNNNELKRMDFVESIAKVVKGLRPAWKVDFDQPKITISIDVMIKVCCVSLLPDYMKLRKYNLIEFASHIKNVTLPETTDKE